MMGFNPVDLAFGNMDALRVSNERLQTENAKLRELVRDMCAWAYIDSNCDLEDGFADRMRELGVVE